MCVNFGWKVFAPKLFAGALTLSVLFLSLLPSLGQAWHRVLPEHTHWYVNNALANDAPVEYLARANARGECLDCDPLAPNAFILHLPDPSGTIQILAMAAALSAPSIAFYPPPFFRRVVLPLLVLSNPHLPLDDPPPRIF